MESRSNRKDGKRGRRRAWFFYLLGVIVTLMGYAGSHVDHLPVVRGILTPLHAGAEEGLATLLSEHELLPGMRGFEELAEVMTRDISFHGEVGAAPPIVKFALEEPLIGFGPKSGGFYQNITVEFEAGGSLEGDVRKFQSDVDSLKSNSLFYYSTVVMLLGLVLQLVGLLSKNGASD